MPVARYVQQHEDRDWAFVKQYHGEVTFLARKKTPIDVLLDGHEAQKWLKQHPDGLVIMRYKNKEDVSGFRQILSIPYRGKMLGIFKDKNAMEKQSLRQPMRRPFPLLYGPAENSGVVAWVLFMKWLSGSQAYQI